MSSRDRLGSDPLDFMKDEVDETVSDSVGGDGTQPPVKSTAGEPPTPPVPKKKKASKRPAKKAVKSGTIERPHVTMAIATAGDGNCVITCTGEFSIYSVKDISPVLFSCLDEYAQVNLDLSPVRKIDTAGYQLILMARREARTRGKTLVVEKPSDDVVRIYDLYGDTLPGEGTV